MDYIIELRKRLIHYLLVIVVVFAVLSLFAKHLYHVLAMPLLHYLPGQHGLIATAVAAPFLAPFKLAFISAFFLTVPFLLYQFWMFVAPALYKHEKRMVWPLMLISSLLFYSGMAFAYFVVFPLVFKFFLSVAPAGVEVMPDITQYLDFSLKLFFAFGAVFEVPVVTVVLIALGLTTVADLKRMRSYVVVGAFIIGMLLTPPDVISQVLLAIPVILLFELGLILSRFIVPRLGQKSPKDKSV